MAQMYSKMVVVHKTVWSQLIVGSLAVTSLDILRWKLKFCHMIKLWVRVLLCLVMCQALPKVTQSPNRIV